MNAKTKTTTHESEPSRIEAPNLDPQPCEPDNPLLPQDDAEKMSYYFCIIGTLDNPLFEYEFGTSKQGGDGVARFPEQARHMNQFIVHSSLDIVEEVQWGSGQMYLKCIDRFYNNYVSCFITGGNVKFFLLHAPTQPTSGASSRASTSIAANPTSPQTEEAIKQFFQEVYENWVKTIMSPFYHVNMPVKSPVFRGRVQAAGKKYL